MRTFIDLTGASGAQYRFRIWPEGQPHLPIAGNYVFVAAGADQIEVLVVGATNDLSQARETLRKAESRRPVHVYTRLNVGRSTRDAEHQDLAAHYSRAVIETGGV